MIPALWFTSSVQHSHDLAAVLREHGIRAYVLHGKTPHEERRRLIGMARAGEIEGLVSCDVISVGFDCPISMMAVMSKPCRSGLWYRQACGRVMRPYPVPLGERSYQQQCLHKILQAARRGVLDQLIVKPTGTGKTRIAAQLPRVLSAWTNRPRMLFLVHREELVLQAAETFRAVNPGLTVGIERAHERAGSAADLVVASVQSLGDKNKGRLDRFPPEQFYAVCTDECMVPGTMVGNIPIESASVGDSVPCFDHQTGKAAVGRVTAVSRSSTKRLVRLHLASGRSIVCTPDHPVYLPEYQDYIAAIDVMSEVVGISCYNPDHGSPLCDLRGSGPGGHGLEAAFVPQDRARVLLGQVPQGRYGRRYGAEPEGQEGPRVSGADEKKQPDEGPSNARESQNHLAGDGVGTDDPWGQWTRPDVPGNGSGGSVGVGVPGGCSDASGEIQPHASPLALQDRRRECHSEDRGGDRRGLPPVAREKDPGPKEGAFLGIDRVEDIEILEQGRDSEFERLCPGGIVYNLEVEGHHNYFANGILVHNCHIAPRSRYHYQTYEHFHCLKGARDRDPDTLHIGFTATPTGRSDGIGLECLYDEIVYQYDLREAIRDGWLADVVGYRAETTVDISRVSTNRMTGDFSVKPLEDAINNPGRNHLVAEKYLEICLQEGMNGPQSNIGHKPHAIILDFVDVSGKHPLVTAPTLFGLRSRWDPHGKSIQEQAEQLELLEKRHPGYDLRREPDLEAVRANLRRIELLAAPEIPPEIARVSRYPWMPEAEASYRLSIMGGKMLTVHHNTLGVWEVYEHNNGVVCPVGFEHTLKEALRLAEGSMSAVERSVCRNTAAWRNEEPSEAQMLHLWRRDYKVRRQYPSSYDWYRFCREQYEAGNPDYSKGGLSRRIDARQ